MMGSYTEVEYGGMRLTADPAGDPDWLLESLSGWDSWSGTQWTASRPDAHGDFAGRVFQRGRQVILTGVALDEERRDELFQRLAETLTLPVDGGTGRPLRVTHAGRTLTAQAHLRGFDPTGSPATWHSGGWGFKIEFYCASPYRWEVASQSVTVGMAQDGVGGLEFDLFTDGTTDTGFLEFGPAGSDGLFTLTNPGSTATPPVFIVHGPCGPFVIESQSTGQALMYSDQVLSGQTLTLSDGSVRLEGVDRGVYLTRRQWWTVPPKGSVTGRFTAAGDPSPARLTVTVTGRHL